MSRSMSARRRNSVPSSRFLRISAKEPNPHTPGKVRNVQYIRPLGNMFFVSKTFQRVEIPGMMHQYEYVPNPGETAIKIGVEGHVRYITLNEWNAHVAKTKKESGNE